MIPKVDTWNANNELNYFRLFIKDPWKYFCLGYMQCFFPAAFNEVSVKIIADSCLRTTDKSIGKQQDKGALSSNRTQNGTSKKAL